MSEPIPFKPKSLQKPDAELDVELGVPALMPGGGWQDWTGGISQSLKGGQFVVGRDPTAPSTSDLVSMIRRDGQARAILNLLTLPIRGTLAQGAWHAPEGESAKAPEVEYANDLWNLPPEAGGMQIPKSKFLRQTLLAFAHGFSAFEQVRTVAEQGPLKGKIVIKKMAYRDPRTIWFVTDDHGECTGMRQTTSFANRSINVFVPAERMWWYTTLDEENPYYGVSLFEPAFEHHQIKRKLYYISHLAAQFAAVPGRLGMLPASPGSAAKVGQFRQALADFAFGGALMVPHGYEVRPFQSSGGQFDFLKLIDHHNTMMAASVLAKFLQQEDRQVLIDNGKADASADLFVQMLDAFSDEIAESWTHDIMSQYISFNFNSGIVPEWRFAPLTDDQKAAVQAMFTTVVVSGTLNSTPQFVRELEKKLATAFDLDIDYKAIEQQEKAAAKAQAEAAQAAQDQATQDQGAAPGSPPGAPAGPPAAGPGPPAAGPGPPGQPVAASAMDAALDDLLVNLSQIAGRDVSVGPVDDIAEGLES